MTRDMENIKIAKAFAEPAIRAKIQHFLYHVVKSCSGSQRLEITTSVI